MSTDLGPAFLADILENPADRAARLIYADWLEDHRGDDPAAQARARFIRAQNVEETADHVDPAWRIAKVEARNLLARYETEWTTDVRDLVRAWTFHGGFVEQVQAAPGALSDLGSRLIQRIPLRRLSLRQAASGWGKLMHCPLLERIEDLEVRSTFQDRPNWLAQFTANPHLSRLRRLFLDRNELPTDAGTLFANAPTLTALEDLTLGRAVTSSAFLRELFRTPRAAQFARLGLTLGWHNTETIEILRDSALPALSALNLQSLDCTEFAAGRLAAIPWLDQLRELKMEIIRPQAGALTRLFSEAALGEQLESLIVRGYVDSTASETVVEIPLERWPNLGVLSLGRNRGEMALTALRREPHLPRLHTLELEGVYLRRQALDSLLAVLSRSPIRELSLPAALLGDGEIERLVTCPAFAGVQELDLSGVPFADRGVNALLQSPHASGLLRLVLRHCTGVSGLHRRALLARFPIVETRP